MGTSLQIESKFLFRNDAQTPLGRVTMAGFIKHSQGVRGTPRVLGSYALVYLLEGSGSYTLGHQTRPVQAGDMLLVFPELPHTYGPGANEYWSEFYCVFDGPAFDLLRVTGLFNPARPVLHLEATVTLLKQLESALPLAGGETLAERTIALSRFAQVITEIVLAGAPNTHAAKPSWISEACRLLNDYGEQAFDLQQIADQIGAPYDTFRKQFGRHMGVSPARYRAIRRIDAACALLHDHLLTTQTIAARLGFSDEFHFSRRFKQIVGVSPRAFRHRLLSGVTNPDGTLWSAEGAERANTTPTALVPIPPNG
jgi:AraC-like DNA-binding protein